MTSKHTYYRIEKDGRVLGTKYSAKGAVKRGRELEAKGHGVEIGAYGVKNRKEYLLNTFDVDELEGM